MPQRIKKPKWPGDVTPYVVETITMPYYMNGDKSFPLCEIRLVNYKGTWSYNFWLHVELYHHCYPSMPNLRRSFETREATLAAAKAFIEEDVTKNWQILQHKGPGPYAKRVLKWIEELPFDRQMEFSLFK